MGILGVLLGLICSRLRRQIVCAVFSGHIVCGCLLRLCGDTQAVGTHIGNQTDCTQSVDIHAFVQFLCHLHGALGLKAQAIGGILLQGRGDKRRCRVALGHPFFHILHGIAGILQPFQQSICGSLVRDLRLVHPFAVHLHQLCRKHLSGRRRRKLRINGPVLLGNKRTDLVFPVYHQAHSYRLYTSGRQTTAHLFPQKRAELITYQTIQDTACLLGIHQIQVDLVGMAHTSLDTAPGDLVELHPVIGIHI